MKNMKAEMAKKLTGKENFSGYANSTISTGKLANIQGGNGELTNGFIIIEDVVDM